MPSLAVFWMKEFGTTAFMRGAWGLREGFSAGTAASVATSSFALGLRVFFTGASAASATIISTVATSSFFFLVFEFLSL